MPAKPLLCSETPNAKLLNEKIFALLQDQDKDNAIAAPGAKPLLFPRAREATDFTLKVAKLGAFITDIGLLSYMAQNPNSNSLSPLLKGAALSDNPDVQEIALRVKDPIIANLAAIMETASKLSADHPSKKAFKSLQYDDYEDRDLTMFNRWISAAKVAATSNVNPLSFSCRDTFENALATAPIRQREDPYYKGIIYVLSHKVSRNPFRDFGRAGMPFPVAFDEELAAKKILKANAPRSVSTPLELF